MIEEVLRVKLKTSSSSSAVRGLPLMEVIISFQSLEPLLRLLFKNKMFWLLLVFIWMSFEIKLLFLLLFLLLLLKMGCICPKQWIKIESITKIGGTLRTTSNIDSIRALNDIFFGHGFTSSPKITFNLVFLQLVSNQNLFNKSFNYWFQ